MSTGLPVRAGLAAAAKRRDGARLQALPVLPGIHIVAGDLLTPTFREQENAVDNAGGLVSYAASRGAEPYPAGTGCLIRFAFEAVATGDAPVTISTQETATLRYWYRIQTLETGGAAVRLTVELLNGAGAPLAQQEWTNVDATEWRESSARRRRRSRACRTA